MREAIRRPGRARIGDVPVGLVVELEASPPVLGLQDTGTDRNRVSCKPSGTSRLTIKRGTEIRPLHYGGLFPIGVVIELYLLS